MKYFIILNILLLCSCSTSKKRYVKNDQNNLFKEESFLHMADKKSICQNKEKIDETLYNLRQSYLSNKNDPLYWNKIATCHYFDENYLKADFFLNKAKLVSSHKTRPIILNNIALIRIKNKKYREAKELLRESINNNSFITPRYNLSLIYLLSHQYKNASSLLKKLYLKNPKDQDILFSYGYALVLEGNPNYALKILNHHQSKKLNYIKSLAYLIKNKNQNAKKLLENINFSNEEELELIVENILEKIEKLEEKTKG